MDGITLGLVCARAGSVGLPGKNLLRLGGERLIERAIRIAFEAGCDAVAVSTDYVAGMDFHADMDSYLGTTVLGTTVWIKRPPELAGPDAGKWEVYQHAVREWEKYTGKTALRIVDVDVTRPLRTAETVRKTLVYLTGGHFPAVMAAAPADKHPAFDIVTTAPDGYTQPYDNAKKYVVRQELPAAYFHAGAYAFTREALFSRDRLFGGPVAMLFADRIESFDIDNELDWQVVQALHASGVPA